MPGFGGDRVMDFSTGGDPARGPADLLIFEGFNNATVTWQLIPLPNNNTGTLITLADPFTNDAVILEGVRFDELNETHFEHRVGNDPVFATMVLESTFFEEPTVQPAFAGLHYVATYADLTASYRGLPTAVAISDAGRQHFASTGQHQGRLTEGYVPFDAQEYVNNYNDLKTAFTHSGVLDVDAAALHYIKHGSAEGRLGFDAMAYIASYADLRAAFGTNETKALAHWNNHGRAEGRKVSFDAQQYLDNYADLTNAFHDDLAAATRHYVANGATEKRVSIDPLDYVASYADLIQAFHNGSEAAVATAGRNHYAAHGAAEGRKASFDAWQYLMNYQDLQDAYGTDVDAAAHHFITAGYFEGRTDDVLIG